MSLLLRLYSKLPPPADSAKKLSIFDPDPCRARPYAGNPRGNFGAEKRLLLYVHLSMLPWDARLLMICTRLWNALAYGMRSRTCMECNQY